MKSPFDNENAIYYGGFDPNGFSSINQAWIYKKSFNELKLNEKKDVILNTFKVEQNYPNPFNSNTIINYTLMKDAEFGIIIYDINGKRIKSNINVIKPAGNHVFKWDGKNEDGNLVPTGIYIFSLDAENDKKQIKMFLIK